MFQSHLLNHLAVLKKIKNTTLDVKKACSLKQDWYLMTIRSREGYDIKGG